MYTEYVLALVHIPHNVAVMKIGHNVVMGYIPTFHVIQCRHYVEFGKWNLILKQGTVPTSGIFLYISHDMQDYLHFTARDEFAHFTQCRVYLHLKLRFLTCGMW